MMVRAHELSVVSRGRRERERNARRETILVAACEAFSSLGFAGSTMEEVALRAEITKPTLYGYFRTKDEILLTLMLPVFVDIGTELEALQHDVEQGLIGSRDQLITKYLDAVLSPYRRDPARYRLTQLLHQTRLVEQLNEATLSQLDVQGRKDFTIGRSILRTAMRQGLIRELPVAPLADVIWGIVVGTIQVEDIKAHTGGRSQHTAALRLAADLLTRALEPVRQESSSDD
jgi:TetR/AcrR family transcriptional regulator